MAWCYNAVDLALCWGRAKYVGLVGMAFLAWDAGDGRYVRRDEVVWGGFRGTSPR